jgi:hypothetical protein
MDMAVMSWLICQRLPWILTSRLVLGELEVLIVVIEECGFS